MWILTSAKFCGIQIVGSEYLHSQLQISFNYKIHAQFKRVFAERINCFTIWIKCMHNPSQQTLASECTLMLYGQFLNVSFAWRYPWYFSVNPVTNKRLLYTLSEIYIVGISLYKFYTFTSTEKTQFWKEIYTLKISQYLKNLLHCTAHRFNKIYELV
jgi:hypothetical protein